MANTNSTTTPTAEITLPLPVRESAITALLKTPLHNALDLFQVLDYCQYFADSLTENDDHTERMALCGHLCAGLELLRVVLKAPLPKHLIERLTVDAGEPDNYRCPLTTDSETLREYCAALTMLLLQGQASIEQEEHITGLLFEMVTVLADDLKAPRFIKTNGGLMMIGGDAITTVH